MCENCGNIYSGKLIKVNNINEMLCIECGKPVKAQFLTGKQLMVAQFMREFNQPVRTSPTWLPPDEIELRMRLINEEANELNDALNARDIYEIADALGDLLYVVYGTACQCGIDIDPVFAEIHRSNMTKKGGTFNEYGKLIKPPTYEPAKLLDIIDSQMESDS